MAALKQMALLVRREALVMAFADVFFVLTVMFVLVACAAMALKKPKPMDAGTGGGH